MFFVSNGSHIHTHTHPYKKFRLNFINKIKFALFYDHSTSQPSFYGILFVRTRTYVHTHTLLIVLCQMDALQRSIKNNNRIRRYQYSNKDNNQHQSNRILVVLWLKCEMKNICYSWWLRFIMSFMSVTYKWNVTTFWSQNFCNTLISSKRRRSECFFR